MEMKNSCRSRWWWGLNPVWFLLKALSLQSPCPPSFPSLFPVLVDPCMVCFPQHHCTICLPSLSVLVPGATVAMAANTFIKQPTRGWLLGGYCCFSFYVPKMHSFSVLIPFVFLLPLHILPISWIVLETQSFLCCSWSSRVNLGVQELCIFTCECA